MRMHTSAAPTAQHGRCQASEAAGRTRGWLAVSTATCFYMVRNWHLARMCGWLPARRRACLSAPLYKNNPLEKRIDGTNVRTGFKNPVGFLKWALPKLHRHAPARTYLLGQRQRSFHALRPGCPPSNPWSRKQFCPRLPSPVRLLRGAKAGAAILRSHAEVGVCSGTPCPSGVRVPKYRHRAANPNNGILCGGNTSAHGRPISTPETMFLSNPKHAPSGAGPAAGRPSASGWAFEHPASLSIVR